MVFVFCLVFVLLTTDLPSTNGSSGNRTYFGCLSAFSSHAKDKGQNIQPYNLKTCKALCKAKNTKFAGIEDSRKMCYCGNYLEEGVKLKKCNGQGKMKVYKLKDTVPLRLLISTPKGISYLENGKFVSLISFAMPGQSYAYVDYHLKRNEMYFIANGIIHRSSFDVSSMQYSQPKPVIADDDLAVFVIDWVKDKIYWTSHPDRGIISESDLDGSNTKWVLVHSRPIASNIAIDPYEGKLFYSFDGSLMMFDLGSRKEQNIGSKPIYYVAADHHSQTVWGVDFSDNTVKSLHYGTILQGRDFVAYSELHTASKLKGLTVKNKEVYYSTKDSNEVQVYSLGPPNTQVNGGTFNQGNVYGLLKVYAEEVQLPTKEFACKALKCPSGCTYPTQHSAECVCPTHMKFDSEKDQCSSGKGGSSDEDSHDDNSGKPEDSSDSNDSSESEDSTEPKIVVDVVTGSNSNESDSYEPNDRPNTPDNEIECTDDDCIPSNRNRH